MDSKRKGVHMLFLTLIEQGHMLPMVDIAKLFAAHGAAVTILTAPVNATFIRPSIDSANSSNILSAINLHVIPFQCAAAGLPEGCENRSFLPSGNLFRNFVRAVHVLLQPLDQAVRDLAPDRVVTDFFMPWTFDVPAERGIPRILFSGSSFFAHCADHSFNWHKPEKPMRRMRSPSSFDFPRRRHRIEMQRSQCPYRTSSHAQRRFHLKSYGAIVNSFHELEPEYADHYRSVVGMKAWSAGPARSATVDPPPWPRGEDAGGAIACLGSTGRSLIRRLRLLREPERVHELSDRGDRSRAGGLGLWIRVGGADRRRLMDP